MPERANIRNFNTQQLSTFRPTKQFQQLDKRFLQKNLKKICKLKYIGYLCIGCRYKDKRYIDKHNKKYLKSVMNTSNNALTEAVYYILLSVLKPMHGYGIMQQISALSGGRLNISAGTLYGALSSLLEKGWIEQVATPSDSRKKEYHITAEGRRLLVQEIARLQELVRNGETILSNN